MRLRALEFTLGHMTDVTRILSAIEQGDPHAAGQLLPLVYEELRKLAAANLAQERPGQTLQPTALVHEAYLRLVGKEGGQHWDGRQHFFAAAAEAMRRILIENARRKQASKHGAGRKRVDLAEVELAGRVTAQELLELDDALTKLAREGMEGRPRRSKPAVSCASPSAFRRLPVATKSSSFIAAAAAACAAKLTLKGERG